MTQQTFEELLELSSQARLLASVAQLLKWDEATHLPPNDGSFRTRQAQNGVLVDLFYEKKSGAQFEQALSRLIDLNSGKILATELSPEHQTVIRWWRKELVQAQFIPQEHHRKLSQATRKAMEAYFKGREENAFDGYASKLQVVVDLAREAAAMWPTGEHPYDAFLQQSEPDWTTSQLLEMCAELRPFVSELHSKLMGKRQANAEFLMAEVDGQKVLEATHLLLHHVGFQTSWGRIDPAPMGFCNGIHPGDVRIGVAIDQKMSLGSLVHALGSWGQGLYARNLPVQYLGTPLCEPASRALGHSQEIFWEEMLASEPSFWEALYPQLQRLFNGHLSGVSLDAFCAGLKVVSPSPVRRSADEIAQQLHNIVRIEMEVALIGGEMEVSDIPAVWNEKMGEALDLFPSDNLSLGCMQDEMWAMGAFGIVPSQILGGAHAGQMYEAFVSEHPTWKERVARADFGFIHRYLTDNFFKHGRLFSPAELIEKATGKPLSLEPYKAYLLTKYR